MFQIMMKGLTYLFLLIFTSSCSDLIKPPQLISVEDIEFFGRENGKIVLSTNILVLNDNFFELKVDEVKSEVFTDSKVIGEVLIDKDFCIDKKSRKIIHALIYLNPENIDSLLFVDSSKNLLLKGYVKTKYLNKKIKFDYDLGINLKNFLESLIDERISKSIFKIRDIKLNNINSSIAELEILLIFANDLGFDFKIRNLSSTLYSNVNKLKVVATSDSLNTIEVFDEKTIEFPVNLNLNLLRIGPRMIMGALKNNLDLYVDFDLKIEVFDIEIPVVLSRKIIINSKTFEISIQ